MARFFGKGGYQFSRSPGDGPESKGQPIPLWIEPKGTDRYHSHTRVGREHATKIRNLMLVDGVYESRRGTGLMGGEAESPVLQTVDFVRQGTKKVTVRFCTRHIQVFEYGSASWRSFPVPLTGSEQDFFAFTGWADKIIFSNGIDGLWELDFRSYVIKLIPKGPSAKHLTTFGNRVVASHTVEGGNDFPLRVRWSEKNNYLNWTEGTDLGAGHEDFYGSPGGATDEVMGVFPYSDEAAWVVRSRSIWILSVTGNAKAPFRPSRFVGGGIGTPYRQTLAETPQGVVFANRDNVFSLTRGAGLQKVGDFIIDEILEEAETLRTSYGTYDTGRDEYRLAVSTLVYRYRFQEQAWTTDEYPWEVKSLSRQVEGKVGLPIDSLPGIIDDLSAAFPPGAINDLVYLREDDNSMMFVPDGTALTIRENDSIRDVLTSGIETDAQIEITSGVINSDAFSACELLELHTEYISFAEQQLIFEATFTDGSVFEPLSIHDIEATDGSEILFSKVERVSRTLQVRLRSLTLGSLRLLGLAPVIVRVERLMASKKPKVASIEISPSTIALTVGSTQQLVITMRDAAGRIVTGKRPTLVSTNGNVAAVTSAGLVRGLTPGSFSIIATLGNIQAQAVGNVAVVAPVLVASVTVTPATPSGAAGTTQQFTATVRDSSNNVLLGRTVVWASSAPAIATVDQNGLVTLIAAGSVVIAATSEGVTGAATLTVTASADVVASVEVTPSSFAGEVGDTAQLTGVAKNGGGTVLAGKVLIWESSNIAVATVNAQGLVTMVGAGSVTITAECEGFDDTSTGTVTALPAAVNTVQVSPTSFSKSPNQTQQLTVTLRDVNNNILTGRVITYQTSNNGVASVSATGLVTALNPGTAIITVTSEGKSATSTATIVQVPVATVTVAPSSFSIQEGETRQLTATVRDAGGTILVGRTVTWGSNNNAVATVSSTGLVSGLASGSATITATCEGISGTSAATITGVVANVVQMQVARYKGATGNGIGIIACPVPENYLPSLAALNAVKVELNGVEIAVELEARGQHPNGDYSALGGWFNCPSIAAGTTIPMRILFGSSPTVARTTFNARFAYTRNSADPRLSGYPDIMATPTSATYLAASKLTGPYTLQTRATTMALGGQHELFWKRFEDFSGWWWDVNSGVGPHGTAPSASNNFAWQACNSNNNNFPGYGDLTSNADDFQAWRVASAYVGGSSYPGNAYDIGKALIEAWMMTADTKYLVRGLSFIAVYTYEFIKRGGMDLFLSGLNGFAIFPDGCAAYYLITGDTMGKLAVEWMADRFFRVLYSGYFAVNDGIGYSATLAQPNGSARGFDGREAGRILQCALAGHRLRSTTSHFTGDNSHNPCDYAAKATEIKNLLLLTGEERYARKADGTWREQRCTDSAGMYINTFMNAIQAIELIKYYEQIDADPDILTAITQMWDTLYSTLFGIWRYTFDGVIIHTATVKSFRNDFDGKCAALNSPNADMGSAEPLTLMYPAIAAWIYKETSDADYLTQADDVFNEGVGDNTVAGEGPAMGEPFGYSRKIHGEHHHNIMPYHMWRNG